MRILHTSDWHLGISTGPASRVEEQGWFLDWLLGALEEHAVDALVIAGDVFDLMHPAAEAQALYYRFLARVGATGVRDVVVVGGNHDSPSHLEAPRALLEAVQVHVVGGLPAADERHERMIVPLHSRTSNEIAAVCLAVPYVHEYRLGIRTTALDRDQTRGAFQTAFSELYRELADEARARFPELPLVATGHLTMGPDSAREDYPQAIHQVGSIEGLGVELLDPRIRYTALGHIHRCYPVKRPSAWYCGTPIAYSLPEMKVPRQVLRVDLEGDPDGAVERLEVPRERGLVQLTGTPEQVLADLGELTWSTRLPPLVHVRVETQLAELGLARRLHEAVASRAEHCRPVLVELQQRATELDRDEAALAVPSLEELEPKEVFGLMCQAHQLEGAARAQLEAAFAEVAAASSETLEAMLASIDVPPKATGDAS